MKTAMITLLISFIVPVTLFAKPPKSDPSVAITVYNDNFAVVKERRDMDFQKGTNKVSFVDVATAIDPTSVNFKCLSSPDAVSILEQNYEYDLVNTHSLLKRYVDREVSVDVKGSGSDKGKNITGILSAAIGSDLILRDEASGQMEIISRNAIEQISLTKMPDELVTKPTLVWLANAEKDSTELCQVTYTTSSIKWKADYSATLNAEENALDLTGWVTIDNKSGAGYKDATIKLIAGDVRRITPPRPAPRSSMKVYSMEMADKAGFSEKDFMEYHLYTLGRKSTINNNQVKQIEFITPAENVPVEKIFIYDFQAKPEKVQVKLEFENKKEYSLGIALPKGKVRVFKKDPADDTLEFVGEDQIDHTPRKEKLSLYIGDAFDIVPEHTTTDSKYSRRKQYEEHKIELRNRKKTPVTVFVDHKFPKGHNWTIDSSFSFEKHDAQTARFKVTIPADKTAELTYSATQTW